MRGNGMRDVEPVLEEGNACNKAKSCSCKPKRHLSILSLVARNNLRVRYLGERDLCTCVSV
jgi:hypothetical protein